MKKTIVFIPTYYYLSHPLFFSIVNEFSGYKRVYLNCKDLWEYNKEAIKKDEILRWFDAYYEISIEPNKNGNLGKLHWFCCKCKECIQNILTEIKQRRWPRGSMRCSDIHNILTQTKPTAIITTSDLTYSARICRQWANKNNVPLIIIQPSFPNFGEFNYNYNLKYRIKYLLFNRILNIPLYKRQALFGNENRNNYLFLWGDYFKESYKGKEVYENIFITGNPVFDKYFMEYKRENNDLRKILEIPSNKKVVTICTQDIDKICGKNVSTSLLDMYKHAIISNERLFFVIKVHPRENFEKYNKAFKDLNKNNYRIIKDVSLYDLYEITDVQVSVMSYSSFEAVVSGIPIVLVDPGSWIPRFDYFNNEIESKAKTAKELSKHLKRCLTEEYKNEFKLKREKYLESRLGCLDGKSGERVVEKIEELIMRGRK